MSENTITNPSYRDVVVPVLRASRSKPTQIYELYSEFDTSATSNDTDEDPYLHHACRCNHFCVVYSLVACGASLLQKDNCGRVPLHIACAYADVDLVTWILSQDDGIATIDEQSIRGTTPLILSIQYAQADTFALLLNRGADISLRDTDDFNAVNFAFGSNQIKMERQLRRLLASLLTISLQKARSGSSIIVDYVDDRIVVKHTEREDIRVLFQRDADDYLTAAAVRGLTRVDIPKWKIYSNMVDAATCAYDHMRDMEEWRPHRDVQLPSAFRAATRAMLLLAKTESTV